MNLRQWLAARGRGEQRRLERESAVSVTTIRQIQDRPMRDVAKARALSKATGGAVSVRELLQLTDEDLGHQLERRAS